MKITDKNARAAANSKIPNSQRLFPLFVSRSATLSEVKSLALKEWHTYLDRLEDRDKKIFQKESGFKPFANGRKTSTFMKTKPTKWFKSITRSTMSRLTQMCTNHAPTGEYFKYAVFKYQDQP